jgi:multiple sugar transport system permease protein
MLKKIRKSAISVVLWVLVAAWFSPVLWMLSTSLKSTNTAVTEDHPQWIPSKITLENYKTIFAPASGINVTRGIINSLIVSGIAIVATLFLSIPAAYALSRLQFRGRTSVFWFYVAILAFPGVIFLIPNFFIINAMGLMNTAAALILPGLGSSFAVFLLRQYMIGLSRDLEDAAWMDGCSRIRFLVTIVVPMVRPTLLVVALMTFLGSWNAFLWPLLVLNTPSKMTLPIALVAFSPPGAFADPFRGIGPLMAGSFVSVVPTLIVFILFYRYLMQGISIGSLGKG